jgi:hypothetical protein
MIGSCEQVQITERSGSRDLSCGLAS